MTVITGFTGPPNIYFKLITKCDKCYYKVRQLFSLQSALVCYYKVRQLFYYKVRQVLLQSTTGITKCDIFNTKCDSTNGRKALKPVGLYQTQFSCFTFPQTQQHSCYINWNLPFSRNSRPNSLACETQTKIV